MLRSQFTEKNKSNFLISGAFIAVAVIVSLLLRFENISDRPFHNDEAVNSIKFMDLFENGEFVYDPIEYHGPTLYYFTLLSAWISGEAQFSDLNEANLRGVNIFSSILFLVGLFWIRKYLSSTSVIVVALLLIVSPFLNFYSRYYIHESLFASFAFLLICSFFAYYIRQNRINSILVGIFAGLVFATKETSIIIFFGIFIAAASTELRKKISLIDIITASVSFSVVSIIFYSSFFSNISGLADSISTFGNYISKSSQNNEHIYPWYYYLKILNYNVFNGTIISESFITLFALIGIIFSFRETKQNRENFFFRTVAIISTIFFIILSFIPYKTPWNIFSSWAGLIFLAGYGISCLFSIMNSKGLKIIFGTFISLLLIHLIYQSYITSYKYPSEAENPYTYSQPTKEIYKLTETIEKISDYDQNILISVVVENDQYWPFPWYFRKTNNISWSSEPSEDIYLFDIIIADTSQIEKITEFIFSNQKPGEMDLYVPLLKNSIDIRPGMPLESYVKHKFITKYHQSTNE